MSLLSICGFESGTSIEGGSNTLAGTASIQSSVVRTGGYALRVNPTTTGIGSFLYYWPDATGKIFNNLAGAASLYLRFYFRVGTLPASGDEEIALVIGNGSIGAYGLRITSGGLIRLYKDELVSTVLVATGTKALATSVWYRIEWKMRVGSTAPYAVKVDGATQFSGTTDTGTTSLWQYYLIGKYQNRNGNSVDFYYDDLAVDDSAYPGVGEVHCLRPRAAGSFAQWTGGTGSTFAEVDEVPYDGDTSYIKSTTSGDVSSFLMDNSGTGGIAGAIHAVQTIAIPRDEGSASSVSVRLRNGSTNRDTSGFDPGGSYSVPAGRIDLTDPNTSASWLSAGLNTIECGVVNGANTAIRVTAIYAMVECVGGSATIPASTLIPLPATLPVPTNSARKLRAELYSASGALLNGGNLESILAANYGGGLGKIGSFSLNVPAEDPNSATASYRQEIRLYHQDEGLVFRGIVDKIETLIDTTNSKVLTISGMGIEVQLSRASTQTGLTLDASPLFDAVNQVLAVPALSGLGWTSGELDSPMTAYTQVVLAPVWPALQSFADTFQLYLRADNINKQVDIGAFGTNRYGIEFRNVEEITPALATNPRIAPIQRIRITGDSNTVVTRIIPQGQSNGIGADFLDISLATGTSPYAPLNLTGPDGDTVYYIEDAAATAAYGLSELVVRYKGISAIGLSATDQVNAANQLLQNASTDLQRRSQVLKSYEVTVAGLRHYINGTPVFQAGDAIHVVYRGMVQDYPGGPRKWLDVDANLYIMDYARTFAADGSDSWTFTVSTVRRAITTDGTTASGMLQSIQVVESAPVPIFSFASGKGQIDANNIQMVIDDGVSLNLISGVDAIQESNADLANHYPRAYITLTRSGTLWEMQLQVRQSTTDFASFDVISDTTNGMIIREGVEFGGVFGSVVQTITSSAAYWGPTDNVFVYLGGRFGEPTYPLDGMIWYRDDWKRWWHRQNGVSMRFPFEAESATAAVITNGSTITTTDTSASRVNPGGAVTGIILSAGALGGQVCTVVNESAFSVTMAASGTSHVANGVSSVIAALTAKRYIWDSSTNLWYQS